MEQTHRDTVLPFGTLELDPQVKWSNERVTCYVRGCRQQLRPPSRSFPGEVCPEHGIRCHGAKTNTPTYSYRDVRRNIIVDPELLATRVVGHPFKFESHRDGSVVLAGRTTAQNSPLANFFAFEDTLRNGCFVAVGDLNGDGKAELVFAVGPGGGPRIRLTDAATVLAAGGFGTLDRLPVSDRGTFFAGNPETRGGVRIAVRDVNGVPTLFVGSGEGLPSERRTYAGSRVVGLTSPGNATLDPFGSVLTDGVFGG